MSLSSAGLRIASGGFVDDRDRKNIEALRRRNEERRRLYLDSKKRAIGVDKSALDSQVEEKRRVEEEERAADYAYVEHQRRLAEMVKSAEQEEERERVQKQNELLVAWRQQRDRTIRSEWDLNDPERLKKDAPPRDPNQTERCPVSSMQQFAGEDRSLGERAREQARQLQEWCDEAMAAKRAAARREREEDRNHAEHLRRLCEAQKEMDVAEEREEAEEAARVRDTNLALYRERRRREKEAQRDEARRGEEETEAKLEDPLLMEDTRQAVSAQAPGRRVRMDHYKGMPAQELESIRREQARQAEEAQRRREREREEERQYAEHVRRLAQKQSRMEAEVAEEEAKMKASLAAQQQEQARLQRQQRARVDKEYEQRVDGSFFDQFGRSCR